MSEYVQSTPSGRGGRCPPVGPRRALAFSAGMAVGAFCVGVLLPVSITLCLIRKAEQKILGI